MTGGGTVTALAGDRYAVAGFTRDEDLPLVADVYGEVEANELDTFLRSAGLRVVGDLPKRPGESSELEIIPAR